MKNTPEADQLMQSYWWKTTSLIWQMDKPWNRWSLPFSVLQEKCEETKEKIYNSFNDLKNHQLFLRASAYWDQDGLVWVLHSESTRPLGVRIDKVLEKIYKQWVSDLVMAYALMFDQNVDYKWVNSVVAMPEIKTGKHSYKNWSIVGHPNIPGHYIISADSWRCEILINNKWEIVKNRNGTLEKEDLTNILQMKQETDNWLLFPDAASQTEYLILDDDELESIWNQLHIFDHTPTKKDFLSNNVKFTQQRYFLPESDYQINVWEYRFNCFGEFPHDLPNYHVDSFWKELPDYPYTMSLQYADPYVFTKNFISNFSNSQWAIAKLFTNSFLKWFDVKRYKLCNNWWLEHDTYRLFATWIPAITRYG